ncbi:MAG: site-specific integrase [Bacteroidales bacterium]|nr:site-specific integrase [Bacteroidales bacterium]
MALKKEVRSDNTYIISQDTTDNPKLGAKILSDGRESLFLDYYFGYTMVYSERLGKEVAKKDRKREYLSLYLWQAPRTPIERKQNKETLELAKKIRYEKGQQILENSEGYRLKKDVETVNFLDWMEVYYENYTKKDKRHIKRARTVFMDFLIDPENKYIPQQDWSEDKKAKIKREKEIKLQRLTIKPNQIDKTKIIAFTEYLQNRFTGEGAHTLYARFKKVLKAAVEADIIRKDPCSGVIIKIDNGALKKDILSIEEIQKLIQTHYTGESQDIRRAFIFCLYCGLRWCDVKDLTFANVDFSNRLLKFEQAKTKGHSVASSVVIPLNEGLLRLIGEPKEGVGKDDLIFPLPSHTMCLKALRHWVKRAEIDKHITWHCARHSFAVNILNNGANIKTVASLLGHSGLKHTEKYTRAVDSLKQEAINSLPELKFD